MQEEVTGKTVTLSVDVAKMSEQVIEKALKDMKKGKNASVLGFPERVQVLLVKLLPVGFVMKTWCRQQGK